MEVDGQDLTSETAGYSLLALTYQARAWQWRVTNARDESILCLAVEE